MASAYLGGSPGKGVLHLVQTRLFWGRWRDLPDTVVRRTAVLGVFLGSVPLRDLQLECVRPPTAGGAPVAFDLN